MQQRQLLQTEELGWRKCSAETNSLPRAIARVLACSRNPNRLKLRGYSEGAAAPSEWVTGAVWYSEACAS